MTRTPVTPQVGVSPGDVVQLSEPDYQYGIGALRLRITRVRLDLSTWYDGHWVWLEGIEIRLDDRDGRSDRYWSTYPRYLSWRRDVAAAVYLSAAVVDQLTAAQGVIDEHATASASGYCLRCHRVGPCPTSEHAAATFARYGRLPRRTPGATRPELINARRLAVRPDPGRPPTSLFSRRYEP